MSFGITIRDHLSQNLLLNQMIEMTVFLPKMAKEGIYGNPSWWNPEIRMKSLEVGEIHRCLQDFSQRWSPRCLSQPASHFERLKSHPFGTLKLPTWRPSLHRAHQQILEIATKIPDPILNPPNFFLKKNELTFIHHSLPNLDVSENSGTPK